MRINMNTVYEMQTQQHNKNLLQRRSEDRQRDGQKKPNKQQFKKKKDGFYIHGAEKLSICCVGGSVVIKAAYRYVFFSFSIDVLCSY